MTRLKVLLGYSLVSFVASGALAYAVLQWVYRSIDRAVSNALQEVS